MWSVTTRITTSATVCQLMRSSVLTVILSTRLASQVMTPSRSRVHRAPGRASGRLRCALAGSGGSAGAGSSRPSQAGGAEVEVSPPSSGTVVDGADGEVARAAQSAQGTPDLDHDFGRGRTRPGPRSPRGCAAAVKYGSSARWVVLPVSVCLVASETRAGGPGASFLCTQPVKTCRLSRQYRVLGRLRYPRSPTIVRLS